MDAGPRRITAEEVALLRAAQRERDDVLTDSRTS
jgi:hypothetical protein